MYFFFTWMAVFCWLAILNPVLHYEVSDQCILHEGGAKMTPYLTLKPKVMATPKLACRWVFAKRF